MKRHWLVRFDPEPPARHLWGAGVDRHCRLANAVARLVDRLGLLPHRAAERLRGVIGGNL